MASSDGESDFSNRNSPPTSSRSPSPEGFFQLPADDRIPAVLDIDELPVYQFSLGDMVAMASQLYAAHLFSWFITFLLCGYGPEYKAVVNTEEDRLPVEEPQDIEATRDFDSLIGLSSNILVEHTELVFTITSKPNDDLRKNVHIMHEFETPAGPVTAPLHAIPNMTFATFKARNSIILVFPRLYSATRQSSFLTSAEKKAIWECGLRPAMVETLGSRAHELPPTLDAEYFRARNRHGRLIYTTKVFPSWQIDELSRLIPIHMIRHGHTWAQDMKYLHIVRGVKNSSYHSMDEESAEISLQEFFIDNCISLERARAPGGGDWYIDIGLELSLKNRCLAWRTGGHAEVYEAVTGASEADSTRITTLGSSQYDRDYTSHLMGVSGCRIRPGVQGEGPHQVAYYQAYVTDKHLTSAREDGRYAKHITGAQLIENPTRCLAFLSKLYTLYQEASSTNYSSARVEVRIPLRHANQVLVNCDLEVIYRGLVSFECEVWWDWRKLRLLALRYLLEFQMRDGVFLCQTPGSVLMLAAVPWLVNSLHATIDDKSASRDLIRAIFPHGDREEVMRNDLLFYTSLAPPTQEMVEAGYEVSVPKADRGAFFVRKISIGPPHEIPSFPGPRFLSTKACETLLGDDLESIITMFMKQKSRGIRNPDRLRNKTIQRRLPPPPDFSTDVVLPVLEGRLLVASRQAGDEENQHNPQPEFFEDNNVHRIVSDISRQFFVDLLRCSPNGSRYTAGRSIRLAEDDIEAADMTTYQETNFSRLFNASRYRMADKTLWRSTFDKFFPPKGMKASDKAQNYHNTAYYPAWIELAGRCTTESFDEIREVVWNSVFNKLYWVPAAQADRIWFTKPDKRYTDLPKHDCAVPVLNIIINHKNPPTFEEDLLAF